MGNSFHTHLADCQTCHMYQLQTLRHHRFRCDDDVVTLTDAAVYSQFVNVLGNHTFMMDYVYQDTNGVEHTADNIAACNQCHASFRTGGFVRLQASAMLRTTTATARSKAFKRRRKEC